MSAKKQALPQPKTPAEAALGLLAKSCDGLLVAAGLLFLFLCALLPLVAKAAWGGSGSPGAGPMPSRATNIKFFCSVWALTALATVLAAYAGRLRDAKLPRAAIVLGVLLGIVAGAFALGLLSI